MPTHSPIDLFERARRYVGKMPAAVSGGGGHDATFHVACVLVQGFGLSVEQAWPIFAEFNQRCDPPWTEKELRHKLAGADKASSARGRGFLSKGAEWKPSQHWSEYHHLEAEAKKAAYDAEKLRRFAARVTNVDLIWLANRSALDPATVDAALFLKTLYQPGEKVGVVTFYYASTIGNGFELWPGANALPVWALASGRNRTDGTNRTNGLPAKPCGVWFINQPLDGEYHPADEGEKMSCRNHRAVTAWRYLVIESDEAPTQQWLNAIAQLPLRIAALYSSGGRSVHALVKVDCANKEACDVEANAMKTALVQLGADTRALTPVRLTRLPGCWRHGKMVECDAARADVPPHPLAAKLKPKKKKQRYERFAAPKLQKLLYINPNPPLAPLAELFPRRDVVKHWCDLASAGIADSDETAGDWIAAGLDYYAGRSQDCAAALLEWMEARV